MINFEDELKKFSPSMEIEEVEDAVRGHELTDMTDIMVAMLRQQKEAAAQAAPGAIPAGQTPVMQTTAAMPVIPNI